MRNDEDIVERTRRSIPSFRISPRSSIGLVTAALLLSGVGVVASRSTPARTASAAHASQKPAVITGPGPFLVYAVNNANGEPSVFARSVRGSASPIFLGSFPGRLTDVPGRQGQAAGAVVPFTTIQELRDQNLMTRVWVVRRGGAPREFLSTIDLVSGFAFDREGSRAAVARRRTAHAYTPGFSLWMYPRSGTPASVASLQRPGGTSTKDSLRPIGWSGNDIVMASYCYECDLVSAPLYRFSHGGVAPLPGTTDAIATDVALDGAGVAFTQATPRDCAGGTSPFTESFACRPRQRLSMLDVASGSVRELGSTSELFFARPTLSPSGALVAYASGRNHEIEWRSSRTGAVVGGIDFPAVDFVPIAWTDSKTIVAVASHDGIDPTVPSETDLVVITRGVLSDGAETEPSLNVLATAPDLTYLGWIA